MQLAHRIYAFVKYYYY